MKKVLYLTKYTSLGASSRLRSLQFIPFLKEEGYEVNFSPLFNDKYLKALYNKKLTKNIYLISGYLKRFFLLFTINKFDIIVIEKELFPYLPSWFEQVFNKLNIKYIVDYDDAIFHNYDLSKNKIIKKLLSNKIDKVMKYSNCVFAGNSYLASRAKVSGAKEVIILPTVINTENYYRVEKENQDDKFILGWIGSPSTYKYIEKLIPVFNELKQKYPNFYVNIIGAKQYEETINNFIYYIPWSEDTEIIEINKFSLGIMPLDETPWELGKCSYKLIQYMGCSIAVLASPVGMNNDVVIADFNGSFVNSNDWFIAIEKYICNIEMTIEQGKNGRKLIDSTYNLTHNLKLIIESFEN
ncbi:glycosyltransferase family 4 protein [Empedobacter brevis]|uniref:Glycosyl transferase n=1 Tax=Empedobacter brevis NBRC 14943 = ATCC 43319 TaxID=1218108 RepID=A0A511NHM9_9FLAO|nr:glycosyltransferase family 4 protein [Empedobacter brevis]QES91967.1 glycosyltransferase family 4 protein [Empedobacter brevis]GEM52274.1 glycosyl transferase [Empedobacter brevis NBRC 14943 = ATCC 43319]